MKWEFQLRIAAGELRALMAIKDIKLGTGIESQEESKKNGPSGLTGDQFDALRTWAGGGLKILRDF